jgi:hypothetical protein
MDQVQASSMDPTSLTRLSLTNNLIPLERPLNLKAAFLSSDLKLSIERVLGTSGLGIQFDERGGGAVFTGTGVDARGKGLERDVLDAAAGALEKGGRGDAGGGAGFVVEAAEGDLDCGGCGGRKSGEEEEGLWVELVSLECSVGKRRGLWDVARSEP